RHRAWDETRHQLTPAVSVQEIIDRAVAGRVPDRFLVGRLEIMDVQHISGADALAKRASKAFSSANVMFLCLRPPFGLGLSALNGSPCSATRPSQPQSRAASSRSHATIPSGCVGAAGPVSSIATQFSAAAPRLCCI